MPRLQHRNGTVVTVADDRVDQLLRNGFTTVDEKPKPATKKATKATKKAK